MSNDARTEGIQELCSSLNAITGLPVTPSTPIADLGVTSLEMLQLVLSMEVPSLIEAFPEFFEAGATPTTVWDTAHAI